MLFSAKWAGTCHCLNARLMNFVTPVSWAWTQLAVAEASDTVLVSFCILPLPLPHCSGPSSCSSRPPAPNPHAYNRILCVADNSGEGCRAGVPGLFEPAGIFVILTQHDGQFQNGCCRRGTQPQNVSCGLHATTQRRSLCCGGGCC